MENNYKFKGQRTERNLSFYEVGKILGSSNVKILEMLRENNILFMSDKHNLPYEKYMNLKWFTVNLIKIDNEHFQGLVPTVRVTNKGFEAIEQLLLENTKYIKNYNQRTFFTSIRIRLKAELENLGISFRVLEEWLMLNSITHTEKISNIVTIFTFIGSEKIVLIKYDIEKKIIFDNER